MCIGSGFKKSYLHTYVTNFQKVQTAYGRLPKVDLQKQRRR